MSHAAGRWSRKRWGTIGFEAVGAALEDASQNEISPPSPGLLRRTVSQQECALQTAHLAGAAGTSDALIAAALLQDIGHLLGPSHNKAGPEVNGTNSDPTA